MADRAGGPVPDRAVMKDLIEAAPQLHRGWPKLRRHTDTPLARVDPTILETYHRLRAFFSLAGGRGTGRAGNSCRPSLCARAQHLRGSSHQHVASEGDTTSMNWRAANVAMSWCCLLRPRTPVVAASHQRSADKNEWAKTFTGKCCHSGAPKLWSWGSACWQGSLALASRPNLPPKDEILEAALHGFGGRSSCLPGEAARCAAQWKNPPNNALGASPPVMRPMPAYEHDRIPGMAPLSASDNPRRATRIRTG